MTISRRSSRRSYLSSSARRRRHLDRMGVALIVACFLTFVACIEACIVLDAHNGVSVSQSLRSVGL